MTSAPSRPPPQFAPTVTTVDSSSAAGRLPAAIPHTLSPYVCVDFVNGRFTDHTGNGHVYDRMRSAEWQEWYAARCGIRGLRRPGPATLRTLTDLRDTLRALLVGQRLPNDATLAHLNDLTSASAQVWELRRAGRVVRPELLWWPQDWRAVIAATAVSYARLVADGAISRLKVCANPDCTWIFVDELRNRSRRWCDSAACGNLLKVRKHRARRAPGR